MIYKRDITGAPENCTCTMIEIPNNVEGSSVKSYSLDTECSICVSLRESQKVTSDANKKIERIKQLKNQIIQLNIEKDKANSLGYSDIVSEKESLIIVAQTELDNLSE
jgi:hypothetical protein